LGLPGLVDEKSAEQPRTGADAGTEPGISADRTDNSAAAGANGGPGQCTLLSGIHIGASNDRQSNGYEQQ
jgi:hypothetical protein